MRKLLVLCLSAALLVGATVPAHAGKPVRSDASYGSASGAWTLVEATAPNTTRITTYYLSGFTGSEWSGADLYFDSETCRTSRRGTTCEWDGWGYGWTESATVAVAADLSSASVAASLRVERYDTRGRLVSATTESLSASFAGAGAVQSAKGSYTYRGECFSYRTTYSESWRPATGTASLGGRDLGTSSDAAIFSGTSRSIERSC